MEIRQRDFADLVCLDVEGRLVLPYEDGRLADRVNSLLLQGHRQIVLNLAGVSQIDTTGLASLTSVRQAAARAGAAIKLANLPPRVHNLLVITRLITLFEVLDAEAGATGGFRSQPV